MRGIVFSIGGCGDGKSSVKGGQEHLKELEVIKRVVFDKTASYCDKVEPNWMCN